MKKIASLLLTAVLLATMLTVFAVPASAAEMVSATEDMTISGNRTYFDISANGKDDGFITINDTNWKEHITPCTLTIESGATITSDYYLSANYGCNIIIKRGASVKCGYVKLENGGTLTIESGASLTCNNFNVNTGCTATVKSGASVMCGNLSIVTDPNGLEIAVAVEPGASFTINGKLSMSSCTFLDIGGTFTGKDTFPVLDGSVTLLPGGTVDLTVTNAGKANELVAQLQKYDEGAKVEQNSDGTYRVTAHRHIYAEEGICCGKTHFENTGSGGTGSTPAVGSALSEGNLTIIIGIAAAVVFGLGGFFIGTKKKKPALADGTENTDEE